MGSDILFGDFKLLVSITTELELFSVSRSSEPITKFAVYWNDVSEYDTCKIISVRVSSCGILKVVID